MSGVNSLQILQIDEFVQDFLERNCFDALE